MSGPLMTASTSARSVGASLATRMVCTAGRLSDQGPRSETGPVYAKSWSAARSRAATSCTSWAKSGMRPTGAGATDMFAALLCGASLHLADLKRDGLIPDHAPVPA